MQKVAVQYNINNSYLFCPAMLSKIDNLGILGFFITNWIYLYVLFDIVTSALVDFFEHLDYITHQQKNPKTRS